MGRYSKKDYELVASVINEARATITDPHAIVSLAHVAGRLAAKFQADNPQFDLERFVKACGLHGKE